MRIKIIIMIENAQHLLKVSCSSEAMHIKSRQLHTKTHASSLSQAEETGSMERGKMTATRTLKSEPWLCYFLAVQCRAGKVTFLSLTDTVEMPISMSLSRGKD